VRQHTHSADEPQRVGRVVKELLRQPREHIRRRALDLLVQLELRLHILRRLGALLGSGVVPQHPLARRARRRATRDGHKVQRLDQRSKAAVHGPDAHIHVEPAGGPLGEQRAVLLLRDAADADRLPLLAHHVHHIPPRAEDRGVLDRDGQRCSVLVQAEALRVLGRQTDRVEQLVPLVRIQFRVDGLVLGLEVRALRHQGRLARRAEPLVGEFVDGLAVDGH